MRRKRLHSKIWLAWGRWWAIQIVFAFELALGIAFHWRRPMLDIYLGPVTIAFGRNAVLTNQHERLRGRCRGFVFVGEEEALL